MGYTQDDLTKLEAALASGALEVEYNDRKVRYRSIKELKEAIQIVKKDLGLVNRSARILCETSKGIC
jgi:hypothetical protein